MASLDHHKLLAGDPTTTEAFLTCARRYVRRFLQGESVIHDVSQSALLEFIDKLRKGLEPKPDEIRAQVLNCASNAVRRELTRLRHQAVSYESTLHLRGEPDVERVLAARQEIERIDKLLEECSDATRQVVDGTVRGQSHREIAEELGLEPGAVRMTLTRARAELHTKLTAQEKLERLRLLARRAGLTHRPSLFRTKSSSSTRRT